MTALRIATALVPLVLGISVHAAEGGKTAPLFASNDTLEVTIRAPLTSIMKERTLDEDQMGTLTYQDPEAGEVTVDVGLQTRGRYRRQYRVCKFAPLRLNFKKSAVKETVFKGSDKLKLVTHCRIGSKQYAQALVSEYLTYRILNIITDKSFRVRRLHITYVDTEKNDRTHSAYGFVIEHKDQLAKRIGLEVNEAPSTEVRYINGAHLNLTSVFQYLIGNTDFSPIRAASGEPCCHNYVLFGREDGNIHAIPYDFDMSGFVSAPHTDTNPQFELRSPRHRLYRGRCAFNGDVPNTVQTFIDKKPAIYELIKSDELYDARTLRNTLRFVDEFYAVMENPQRVERNITDECVR